MLDDILALSIRCDGSVDRTQIDKIFVQLKSLNKMGKEEQYFLGAAEPEERGAKGICGAVETACINTVGQANFNQILLKNVLACH